MVTTGPLTPAQRARIVNARHRFRDERGRFRAGTAAERYQQDVLDATAAYFGARLAGQKREYSVYEGARTRREFAIRRGRLVPLDREVIRKTLKEYEGVGILLLLWELRRTSPVDTGLLRSQWRSEPGYIINPVPYTHATNYINESSRGYVDRAIAKTMRELRRTGQHRFRQKDLRIEVRI